MWRVRRPEVDLMSYQGESMVAGTNARLRQLLGADIVPARRLRAQAVPGNKPSATDKPGDSRRMPLCSSEPAWGQTVTYTSRTDPSSLPAPDLVAVVLPWRCRQKAGK